MLIDYINRTKIENQIQDAICEVAENIDIREYIKHETIIEKVTEALENEISDMIDDIVDDVIEKM